MLRILLGFLFVWVSVTVGIQAFRGLTKAEKWDTAKSIWFGFFTAAVSAALIALFVIFF